MIEKLTALGTAVALSTLGIVGCADDEARPGFEDADAQDVDLSGEDNVEPVVLATISNDAGRVEWLAPEVIGDEPEMVITINGNEAPLIHPDLAEKVGTVQSYLALVPAEDPLPAALAPYARDYDQVVLADRASRIALIDENTRINRDVELANNEIADDDVVFLAGGCSATQKAIAKNSYGAAYSAGGGSSGSKTCGEAMSFHNTTGTTFYCNNGSDCDYGLGGGDGGECDPNGCTFVKGKTRAFRARSQSSAGGNVAVSHYGKRYRFGFKNCSYTYSATMRRRRGGGSWIYTTIAPNSMQIRVGGGAYPPPYALVRDVVAWGVWEESHNWGTSADPLNTMEMTAPTEGFFCADIIQRFETQEQFINQCNPGPLCDDNSCKGTGRDTGCWD